EMNAILSNMDFGYLPYWLSGEKILVSRTSFPTKFSSYMKNSLLVINHAPSDSEVANLVNRYQVGINIHSYKTEDIIKNLEKLISISENTKNIENCIFEQLSLDQMMLNVKVLLS